MSVEWHTCCFVSCFVFRGCSLTFVELSFRRRAVLALHYLVVFLVPVDSLPFSLYVALDFAHRPMRNHG